MKNQIVITGQQFLLLKAIAKGKKSISAAYGFLAARVNEIPIKEQKTDIDAILYCLNNSVVKTDPHKVINFYESYKKKYSRNRLQNRTMLKAQGVTI